MVDEVLGESFEGILVSDFSAAYDHYPRLKQRCWSHLLRDIHALKVWYPEDGGLERWAWGVQRLYVKGQGWAAVGGLPLSVPGTVGAGAPVAGAVPSFPGIPVGSASQAMPAD